MLNANFAERKVDTFLGIARDKILTSLVGIVLLPEMIFISYDLHRLVVQYRFLFLL